MSQSPRPSKSTATPSTLLTTPNIMVGIALGLILIFVLMSVFSIGPFSWGN